MNKDEQSKTSYMYMYTTKVTIHRKTEIGKYPKNTLQQRTNLCNC